MFGRCRCGQYHWLRSPWRSLKLWLVFQGWRSDTREWDEVAAMQSDIPGLNPIEIERIMRVTVMTCNRFRGSEHGNAQPHTTGELVRCLNCDDPQWKHWLRAAALGVEERRAAQSGALATTGLGPDAPCDRCGHALRDHVIPVHRNCVRCPCTRLGPHPYERTTDVQG